VKRLDLNVDIGEGFPYDERLLHYATSANVCCGEHAGSWDLTKETILRCLVAGVRVGIHPGYPDREHMGRRPLAEGEARSYSVSVREQVERFFLFVPAAYVKPHGALYNDAVAGSGPALEMVAEACGRFSLPLMGLPGTALAEVASRQGVPLIREGFADRAYRPDGALVPRTEPGAVLEREEEVRRQVLRLADEVDSICLHGDTPHCVAFAERVCQTLLEAGYDVGA
jgi:5-oxoprolinase (ATP-hydrolysing) subunit A